MQACAWQPPVTHVPGCVILGKPVTAVGEQDQRMDVFCFVFFLLQISNVRKRMSKVFLLRRTCEIFIRSSNKSLITRYHFQCLFTTISVPGPLSQPLIYIKDLTSHNFYRTWWYFSWLWRWLVGQLVYYSTCLLGELGQLQVGTGTKL